LARFSRKYRFPARGTFAAIFNGIRTVCATRIAVMAEEARQARFKRQPLSEATEGRGVDVVLNSLTGQAIIQGLKCLAPFGRFIELGKTDIYGNAALGLKPLGEGASKNMPSFDDKYQRHTGVLDTLR